MDNRQTKESLPQCAAEYIELVAGKIGYARELSSAFEAELRGLKDEDGRAKKALSIIAQLWKPERLAALILKGQRLCEPLWRKAIAWALRAVAVGILCVVAFLFCELLPMSLTIIPQIVFFCGTAICLYLVCYYWLPRRKRKRLIVCAGRVSWASEQIADKHGAFVMPKAARDYIGLVARKVGYRKRVRAEVREELEGHFYDALMGIGDKQERLERAAAVVKEFGDARMLAKLIRRGKKRCRPMWLKALIRTCQAAGIVFVCLVVFTFWFFSGKPHITVDYVAEMNRLEQPLADESLNAWVNYQKAFSLTVAEPKGFPYPREDPNDPNEEAKIREWVATNDKAIDEVLLGNEKPHRWRKYESRSGSLMDMLIPWLSEYKSLTFAMWWKARFAAEAGDMESAAMWLDRATKFKSKAINPDSSLVEQLVCFAVTRLTGQVALIIIQNHNLSSREMETLQKTIEDNLGEIDFRSSLDGERMYIEDTVQRTFTATGLIAPEDTLRRVISLDPDSNLRRHGMAESMSLAEALPGWLGYGKVLLVTKGETLRDAQRFLDETQKVLDMTPYEARRAGTSPGLLAASMKEQNPYLGILMFDTSNSWQVLYTSRAEAQACPVIIAAHRYKLDKGLWPQSMDELYQAGYIKTTPMDPWSDRPLVYRKTEDGFTLYSLGPNFADDGGAHVPWPKRKSPGMIYNDPEDFKGDLVYWPMPPTEKRQWY